MQQEVGASEAGGKPEVCGIMETNGGRICQEKERHHLYRTLLIEDESYELD